MQDLGDQLRQAMKDSGMSLFAISRETGLDYGLVHRFAHKRRDIRIGTAARMTALLGLRLAPAPKKPRRKK